MKVLLLSGEVHCGKTTILKGWCERAIAAGAVVQGTLAWPDDERGRRHFTSLPAFETRRAQVSLDDDGAEERALLQDAGAEVVKVGPYTFRKDVFEWAKACVEEPLCAPCPKCSLPPSACTCRARYLVLDEVGPLEINRGGGLEPSVTRLFAAMRSGAAPANLVVVAVVRSRCVEAFKDKYTKSDGDGGGCGTPGMAAIPVEAEFLKSQDWETFSKGIEYVFPYIKKE